jgi:nucleotide-binding universal stress UspA family protein
LPHYASAVEEAVAEERPAATYFEQLLAEARPEPAAAGVHLETEAVHGHASQAIVDYSRQIGADLIVVGQHSHPGVMDRMLGSTSDRVVDTAECSVLVVPARLHDHH